MSMRRFAGAMLAPDMALDQGLLLLEEVEYVEAQVVKAVWPTLQARRFMPVTRLPNAGYMWAKHYTETDMGPATITQYGDAEAEDVTIYEEDRLLIPIIEKDFFINWRHLLASRNFGEPLDTMYAENAGRQVAEAEDQLLLTGETPLFPALGLEELSTATGRLTQASAGNWPANAFTDIKNSLSQIQSAGFRMPFVMIAPVALVKCLYDQITNTLGTYYTFVLDNYVSAIYEDDLLFSSVDGSDSVLIVKSDPMNFDIVQAMPPTVGWYERKKGNMHGWIREAVVGRIKRPTSIVEITGVNCA